MRNDGGPAFPNHGENTSAYPIYDGMTLRDYFMAHAPAREIHDLVPPSIDGCAKFVGVKIDDYVGQKHYPQALAKARGMWADAMLAERSK